MSSKKKHSEKIKKETQVSVVALGDLATSSSGMESTHNLQSFAGLLKTFKLQALVLVVLGFILYSNSFFNEYALDDGIVIQKNEYVQNGLRGIPKIMSTDAYDSFYKQMNAKQQLSGGRYRPLSVVTFAIEQQFFGSNQTEKPETDVAFIRHVLNVVFYILSVVLLLYFLRNFIFKEHPVIAFIACLIFLIHPIHTEVVANVKSRDEILSFLFIILTFINVVRYDETKQKKQLFLALFTYFLALLSKEYAVTLLALIPMLLYIVRNTTLKESILKTIPFIFIAAIYLAIRFSIVGKGAGVDNPDVLNSPFKFATPSQKWATEIEILNHYLRLLFYPNPLSSDYSYNTIPYTDFKNGWVWVAIVTHVSMIAATVVLFFKRNILAFAFAFYLLHLFLVSNFFMPLGATMGERLIYHSSLGFSMFVAVLLGRIIKKTTATSEVVNEKSTRITKGLVGVIIVLITCWSTVVVIKRNAEWKNDASLFIADAATVPNSALVNGNAGKAYIDMSEKLENKAQEQELILKGIYYLKKSVLIHDEYVNGYLNLGVAYFKLKQYDEARANWEIAKHIYPNNPFLKRNLELMGTVYYNEAMTKGRQQPRDAQQLLEKALEVAPNNADYWYNLGGVSYTIGDFEKAKQAWTKTLLLNPNNEEAKRGMAALQAQKK
jgi:tetratricopeptide (TPR) repeat protein